MGRFLIIRPSSGIIAKLDDSHDADKVLAEQGREEKETLIEKEDFYSTFFE